MQDIEKLSLEQITQKLRKNTGAELKPYLDELVKRVDASYLEFIDKLVPDAGDEADGWDPYKHGWFKVSKLDEVAPHDSIVLFYFRYDSNDEYACFNKEKHFNEAAGTAATYNPQCGYYVIARRSYRDGWTALASKHMLTRDVAVDVDVTKAERFAIFSHTSSHVTREGVIASNRALRRTVHELKSTLEQKNRELDALGYVWCTGNCSSGQFRFNDMQQITPAMLDAVASVSTRLLARGANTSSYAASRLADNVEKRFQSRARGDQQRLSFYKQVITKAADICATNAEEVNVTLRPIIDITTPDGSVSQELVVEHALSHLLQSGAVICKRVDNIPRLFINNVHGLNWPESLIEVDYDDIEQIYAAAKVTGGMMQFCIDRLKKLPPRGWCDELKKAGVWKPEWDEFK